MSVRVSTDVWENSTHGSTELLVLLKLADNADDEHRIAWPSVGSLARFCRVSERTVQYALRRLEASGEITRVKPFARYKGATYRIGCKSCTHGAGMGATGGTPWVQPVAPESSVEPSIERNKKESGFAPQIGEVWDAYIESTGRQRSKLDAKRSALIRRQLRVYPLQDLLDAVRGWKRSEWHRGENPGQKPYNNIELLLRDSEHIEKFRDLERGIGHVESPTDRLVAEIRAAKEAGGGASR